VAALVVGPDGTVLGWQTKNQLDPTEDRFYVPGRTRRLFEIEGLRFGVAICHEGWRYPETVRWAARRGAHVVFHPQHTGATRDGIRRITWGEPGAPYYEKAMTMRAIENGVYFASVNYALPFQESATTLIAPTGECQAHLPYGAEGVLVADVHPEAATGLLARRFAPERYGDESGSAGTA
jgi:predicted amidohydrolase